MSDAFPKPALEYESGAYLPGPDLFVERLDRALIERPVADLIARGGLRKEWEILDQPEDA
jgi:hypothetical protein